MTDDGGNNGLGRGGGGLAWVRYIKDSVKPRSCDNHWVGALTALQQRVTEDFNQVRVFEVLYVIIILIRDAVE